MACSRSRAVSAIVAVTVLVLATSASAVIVLDSTYTTGAKVPPGGATGTYSITSAVQSSAGFDLSSSDKLVVVVGSRRDRTSTHWINGVTYNGLSMIEAVQQRSGNGVEETTGIYYLDSPSGLGDLVVSLNARAWADDSGIAMLGLSGTAPGVAAASGAIGTSTALNIPVDDTIVIAGSENLTNTGTPTPQSPLTSLGSNHLGSGYQFVSSAGTVTPTFGSTGATTVAAAFAAAGGGPGPGPVDIHVGNFSFEIPVLSDGDWSWSMDNQGWGYSGNDGYQGSWNVTTGDYPGEAPHGENVGWAEPGSGVPGGFGQVLNAMLEEGLTYTLTVEVGSAIGYGWDGYKIQLLAGGTPHTPGTGGDYTGPVIGGVLLAEDDDSLTVAEGTFETSTITFTYDPALHSGLLGQPLQIRLLANPGGDGVDFDNVRLTALAPDLIPEPATLSLLGLGALLALRRRRRSR